MRKKREPSARKRAAAATEKGRAKRTAKPSPGRGSARNASTKPVSTAFSSSPKTSGPGTSVARGGRGNAVSKDVDNVRQGPRSARGAAARAAATDAQVAGRSGAYKAGQAVGRAGRVLGPAGVAVGLAMAQDEKQGKVDRGETRAPRPGGAGRRDRRRGTPAAAPTSTPAPTAGGASSPAPTARPNRNTSPRPTPRPSRQREPEMDLNRLTLAGHSRAEINKMTPAEMRRAHSEAVKKGYRKGGMATKNKGKC